MNNKFNVIDFKNELKNLSNSIPASERSIKYFVKQSFKEIEESIESGVRISAITRKLSEMLGRDVSEGTLKNYLSEIRNFELDQKNREINKSYHEGVFNHFELNDNLKKEC